MIALLSIFGIAISSISLYQHYATSKSEYCDFGANFNCDIVNRSTYSTVAGVPVALMGTIGYSVLFGLAVLCRRKPKSLLLLTAASGSGLVFALYLTYIEKFVLAVWCALCLTSLGLIFSIAMLSALATIRSPK